MAAQHGALESRGLVQIPVRSQEDSMAGYAIIWLFFIVIALLFLTTVIGYYSARIAFRVWQSWRRP
jgi:hypothetical protein